MSYKANLFYQRIQPTLTQTPTPYTFQLLILATTQGTADRVRIDDVDLIHGPCPPSLTCNFDDESQTCMWENAFELGASLPWSIGSGSENISAGPE